MKNRMLTVFGKFLHELGLFSELKYRLKDPDKD